MKILLLLIAIDLSIMAAGVSFAVWQEYRLQNAPTQMMGPMVIQPDPDKPPHLPAPEDGSRG